MLQNEAANFLMNVHTTVLGLLRCWDIRARSRLESLSKWLATGAASTATRVRALRPAGFHKQRTCFHLLNHLNAQFLQDIWQSKGGQHRQTEYNCCFRGLPAYEHAEQCLPKAASQDRSAPAGPSAPADEQQAESTTQKQAQVRE